MKTKKVKVKTGSEEVKGELQTIGAVDLMTNFLKTLRREGVGDRLEEPVNGVPGKSILCRIMKDSHDLMISLGVDPFTCQLSE